MFTSQKNNVVFFMTPMQFFTQPNYQFYSIFLQQLSYAKNGNGKLLLCHAASQTSYSQCLPIGIIKFCANIIEILCSNLSDLLHTYQNLSMHETTIILSHYTSQLRRVKVVCYQKMVKYWKWFRTTCTHLISVMDFHCVKDRFKVPSYMYS